MSHDAGLKHENLYLSETAKARLDHLKIVDRKIIQKVRAAVEAEIEREWRKLCAVSGVDPKANPGHRP
jgi:hypothetical protein